MSDHATIESMLGAMEKRGASDLFLCAGRHPALRLNGQVVATDLAPTTEEELESFARSVVGDAAFARFQATGDLDAGWTLAPGRRFRLNFARQQGQASMVARALPSGDLEFTDLGLPGEAATLADLARGLVLVTGATGSGKSTTLAAMIHRINTTRPAHVVTIEEPIEFVHADKRSRITQREVGQDTASFDSGLRQVLRESPDVIMIGEMRDPGSMRVALQAALTGHLVLTTLHTIDAAQTLQRIMSYFPEDQRPQVALDLSLCLKGIVSQRLLPRKDGTGRVVAVELLTVSPAAARLIADQRIEDLSDLVRGSTDPATTGFLRSLLRLFRKGDIDYSTGLAAASNPEEYALSCRGMETGVRAFGAEGDAGDAAGLDMKALLGTVTDRRASDLHLSVGRPPTIRVGGDLVALDAPPLTPTDVRLLVHSVLTSRQRGTYELERELDFSLSIADGRRFRVNVYHEKGHMAAALRAIESRIPSAEELGLPKAVVAMSQERQGLILVVGPTGSGKTTTLACLVDRINRSRPCHVMTVEDPIEYVHSSDVSTVHQREVGSDTLGFAAALKYVLRQDPDVVLIGEMRDLETIAAAITTAETGHLVMATLHTNDAVQSVDRIIDVFPAHQQPQVRTQLAAALLGVVSQRLLPRVGGKGQVAAFEVLAATTPIRTLIRENKMHQALGVMQTSGQHGMVTLDAALARLVETGAIARHEALRLARNPNAIPEEVAR